MNSLALSFIQKITHELETDYEVDDVHLSDLTVYQMDLSALRLRMSSEVPCIVITRANLEEFSESELLSTLSQEIMLRQETPGTAMVLVEENVGFLNQLTLAPYWTLLLCRNELESLITHPNPKRGFAELVRSKTPLRFISPYDAERPAEGSQFYGRTTELNLILSHHERSFSIEGGRRIGKTSLLREARRKLRKMLPPDQHVRLVWFDFWGYNGIDSFVAEVIRHFEQTPRPSVGSLIDYFPRFMKLMRKRYNGRIVFFLDEIDDLIEHERQHGYELLNTLKRIEASGDCRCLIAGFRTLTAERQNYNSPLRFCQPLELTNLTRRQSYEMLQDPMSAMGVRIDRPVRDQIYYDTAGHPQLLQLYGQSLIQMLDEESGREVSFRHITRVVQGGIVYDRLVDTLRENTTDLEYALICELSRESQFDVREIDEILVEHGLDLSAKEIDRICRSLKSIGVIERAGIEADVYHFAIPLQPALAARGVRAKELAWRKAREKHSLASRI